MFASSPTVTVHSSKHIAARLSIASAIAFVAIVLLLHFVKPELAPSWRFVSEYAIGSNGWLMVLAFSCWAISCFALAAALRPHVRTVAGRIGLIVLLLVGLSLIAAGLFTADPITAKPEELTTAGRLHGAAAMVGIPGFPIAALLIGWSLARNPAWSAVRRSVVWAGVATLVCMVAMFGYMSVALPKAGGFGPGLLVGWFNRLLVLSYVAWQIVVARGTIGVRA